MAIFLRFMLILTVMPTSGVSAQGPTYGSGACSNTLYDWNYLPPVGIDGYYFNVLAIDKRSRKTWNGKPITDDIMMLRLRQSADVVMRPMVILRPRADTGCEEVIRLRRIMTDILDCEQACKEGEKFNAFVMR